MGDPRSQPSTATPQPWTVSEVRSVEGEYLIVGGVGQEFGLIASCPVKADAEAIVAAQARIKELEGALRGLVARYDHFQTTHGDQASAYYSLVKGAYSQWDDARAALNPKGAA